MLENNEVKPQKQDDSLSCYAEMLSKEMSEIDWSKPSKDIINLIYGTNPWPVAHTGYNGEALKIYKAVKGNQISNNNCFGEVLSTSKKGIEVLCGDNKSVYITELQISGKKE